VAVISLQIGIMNLLPLPPLDGGAPRHHGGGGPAAPRLQPGREGLDHERRAVALFLPIGLVLSSAAAILR
jgi:hypothetical protein